MTWIELIIVVCIGAVLVAPFVNSPRAQKAIRLTAAVVLILVLAFYGVEIARDLL